MKKVLPAKTFLVGEYAAIYDGPSIVITTQPCFELHCQRASEFSLNNIHPQSPAGLWLARKKKIEASFNFFDPYQNLGGLGASSAQFIGVYQAYNQLQGINYTHKQLLEAYYDVAWSGQGLKPSGHDVWAQLNQACVLYDGQYRTSKAWPFTELDFALIRTGIKIPTHEHLQTIKSTLNIDELNSLTREAIIAFHNQDELLFISSINAYAQALIKQGFCASHTQTLLHTLNAYPFVLAAKGCGAMGADILLVIYRKNQQTELINCLNTINHQYFATSKDLYLHKI